MRFRRIRVIISLFLVYSLIADRPSGRVCQSCSCFLLGSAQHCHAVDREALESSSPALQAGAKPSQLPVRLVPAWIVPRKKPRCLGDTGQCVLRKQSAECQKCNERHRAFAFLSAKSPNDLATCLVFDRFKSMALVLSRLVTSRQSERSFRVRKGIDVDRWGWFTAIPKKTHWGGQTDKWINGIDRQKDPVHRSQHDA